MDLYTIITLSPLWIFLLLMVIGLIHDTITGDIWESKGPVYYQDKWDEKRAKYTELDNKINENESIITANKYKILELTDKGEIAELKKQNAKLRLDNQEMKKEQKKYAVYMKSVIPPTRGSYKLY